MSSDTENGSPNECGSETAQELTSDAETEGVTSHADSVVETEADYSTLDPKWLILERISSAIGYGIFATIAGAISFFVSREADPPVPLILSVVAIAALPLLIGLVWFWPKWSFRRWSYSIGPKLIELRHGVIWQSSVMVPMSRLQHVDMQRGPLERKFGLASLILHTAGTQDATHTIPGLDFQTASQLRDQLIDVANRGAVRSK